MTESDEDGITETDKDGISRTSSPSLRWALSSWTFFSFAWVARNRVYLVCIWFAFVWTALTSTYAPNICSYGHISSRWLLDTASALYDVLLQSQCPSCIPDFAFLSKWLSTWTIQRHRLTLRVCSRQTRFVLAHCSTSGIKHHQVYVRRHQCQGLNPHPTSDAQVLYSSDSQGVAWLQLLRCPLSSFTSISFELVGILQYAVRRCEVSWSREVDIFPQRQAPWMHILSN